MPTKAFWSRRDLPRSRDKTDPSPTGSDTKPRTPSDIMLSEDTGEEQN